jgi:Ca-activated chloride channel family protein
MNFLWPDLLWLAALLPVLVLLYLWLLRRRKKVVLHYANMALVKQAMTGSRGWRRVLPPALLLCAVTLLIVAAARPTAVMTLPTQQQTVMLVMDVSLSMAATDVLPDRMRASQEAAKAFVAELPRDVRIGVVAYGGTAHLVQAPTLNRDEVMASNDRFQLQRGTAIGSGIAVALATLFPEAGIDLSRLPGPRGSAPLGFGPLVPQAPQPSEAAEPGSNESAAMVVLTDGQNTAGLDPTEAARMAAGRGVKVYTVGFGTRDGVPLHFDGWSVLVRLDEDTLKRVSDLTEGQYFHAASGADLQRVYGALQSRLEFEAKETEVTSLFAAVASLLTLLAAGLSVWWFGRLS